MKKFGFDVRRIKNRKNGKLETLYALYMCESKGWFTKAAILRMANGLFPELRETIPHHWKRHLKRT